MDLINREINKYDRSSSDEGVDPFQGNPSVVLFREHPLDEDTLTGVLLAYPSGYTLDVALGLGMGDSDIEIALERNEEDELPELDTTARVDEVLPDSVIENLVVNGNSEENQDSEIGSDGSGSFFDDYVPPLPQGVDRNHPDFYYYANYRLNTVTLTTYDANKDMVKGEIVHLIYDHRSSLTATVVERI